MRLQIVLLQDAPDAALADARLARKPDRLGFALQVGGQCRQRPQLRRQAQRLGLLACHADHPGFRVRQNLGAPAGGGNDLSSRCARPPPTPCRHICRWLGATRPTSRCICEIDNPAAYLSSTFARVTSRAGAVAARLNVVSISRSDSDNSNAARSVRLAMSRSLIGPGQHHASASPRCKLIEETNYYFYHFRWPLFHPMLSNDPHWREEGVVRIRRRGPAPHNPPHGRSRSRIVWRNLFSPNSSTSGRPLRCAGSSFPPPPRFAIVARTGNEDFGRTTWDSR